MPPKKKVNKEITTTNPINFYSLEECEAFKIEHHNPNYNEDTMPLKHPFNMVINGVSGSGKSNILLDIIHKLNNTFEYIYIFTQNAEEQLYEYLKSKIPHPYLKIFEGIEELNKLDIDNLEKAQYLFIYDDMCVETDRKQEKIKYLYTRGRKLGQKCGITNIYLSQSYYDTPKLIRKNMSKLILKKVNGARDIRGMLKECSLDASPEQLMRMYNYCVPSKEHITDFLFVDISATDERRFRKNWVEILQPNQFGL